MGYDVGATQFREGDLHGKDASRRGRSAAWASAAKHAALRTAHSGGDALAAALFDGRRGRRRPVRRQDGAGRGRRFGGRDHQSAAEFLRGTLLRRGHRRCAVLWCARPRECQPRGAYGGAAGRLGRCDHDRDRRVLCAGSLIRARHAGGYHAVFHRLYALVFFRDDPHDDL